MQREALLLEMVEYSCSRQRYAAAESVADMQTPTWTLEQDIAVISIYLTLICAIADGKAARFICNVAMLMPAHHAPATKQRRGERM